MNLSQLHARLTEEGVITSSRPYLSQLVREGKIPYEGEGRKKTFNFKKVIKALGEYKVRVEPPANAKKTIHDLPKKKDGQTSDEYKEELKMELGDDPSLSDSKTFLTIYQGKLAQQKFDIEAGLLIYKEEVENTGFELARTIREQLLVIPEKVSAELAGVTDVIEVREVLYGEILKTLSSIADGSFYNQKG